MHILGDISVSQFLSEYWQKKPLLIRNAFKAFESPLEPDDLAGLALEEMIESRIILEQGETPWQLLNGPFTEQVFRDLPEEKWTLLVQGVDQWVPEVAELLQHFQFIPKWRLDDVMVSFAPKGGSVGPHFDQYDVFLLQAHGQRTWQLGPKYDTTAERVSDTPLNILKHMDLTDEWTLEPGDMLYIPPQYAHNGVAVNDCMTFSFGFRAPSHAEIIGGVSQHIMTDLNEEQRYSDAERSESTSPALIEERAFSEIEHIVQQNLNNPLALREWFTEYMTQPKYPELCEPLEEPLEWDELAPLLTPSTVLMQNETSRWAYFEHEGNVHFYCNGQPVIQSNDTKLIELCRGIWDNTTTSVMEISANLDQNTVQQLLLTLINNNTLYIEAHDTV